MSRRAEDQGGVRALIARRAVDALLGATWIRFGAGLTIFDEEGHDLRFDAEGRWRSISAEGRHLRRALDGAVYETAGDRLWRLDDADARAVHEAVAEAAARLAERHAGAELAAAWSAARLEAEGARFAEVYAPVGILPPDRYRNVIAELALGCPWNACHFCDSFEDASFRVRSGPELDRHLESVRGFFGRALAARRGVFLGQANALALSTARLHDGIGRVRSALDGRLADSADLGAFFDPHRAPARTPAEWGELAAAGLASVAIGLESGDDALLERLGKGGGAGAVIEGARAAKAAGIRVSIMVLTGFGAEDEAERHRRASARAIERMELGREDLVFLSPLEPRPGLAIPLRPDGGALEHHLRGVTRARLSPYRYRSFVYWS